MFKRFFKRKKDKEKERELENKVEENLTKESNTFEEDFGGVSGAIEEEVEDIGDNDNIFEKVSLNNTIEAIDDIENIKAVYEEGSNTIVLEDLTEESLDVEEILEDILTSKIEKESVENDNTVVLSEEIENLYEEELLKIAVTKDLEDIDNQEHTNLSTEVIQEETDYKNTDNNDIVESIKDEIISSEDVVASNSIEEDLYILDIKIKRGKSIKVRDLYTEEEQIFKTHKECSRKLKLPLCYIKENLKYGYTDYLGQAINFLTKELQTSIEDNSDFDEFSYLENTKTPMEQFNMLNDKIFKARISESKRDSILSSIKIEPVKMHYTFECIDNEYDDYFEKYKSIILRGGKKKIELVSKNGEAIEIFKSIDECANYLNKDREEVLDMLKCGNTKVGRYEIRYSLRNI